MLVIDDSAVVRGMLSKLITADPVLELAGTAADGRLGVEKAARLQPDIIVLDVEMPDMSGLQALVELRAAHPKTPIVMFSAQTDSGAAASVEALANGASDCAMKPSNTGSSLSAAAQVKEDLLLKLKTLLGVGPQPKPQRSALPDSRTVRTDRPASTTKPLVTRSVNRPVRLPNKRIDAVIIGSSTGGPAALEQVLGGIRQPLPIPILITQHLPAAFSDALAVRLDRRTRFPVLVAEDGMALEGGRCYLAPGGRHLGLASAGVGRAVVELSDEAKIKSCRPSVEYMAASARELFNDRLLAVMLTGMGDDGADEYCKLAELGVEIIVQDEESSVVWGMPGVVQRSGAAEKCLPLPHIANAIVRSATAGRAIRTGASR